MRIPEAGAEGNNFATKGAAPQPRLVAAAHEFEAQMMKELLKPLEQSSLSSEGSEGEEGSGGALGEFATEALGTSLSRHGGLGIANRILGDFSARIPDNKPESKGPMQD